MAAFFLMSYILVTSKISAITKKARTPAAPERGGGPSQTVEGFKLRRGFATERGGGPSQMVEVFNVIEDKNTVYKKKKFLSFPRP